MNQESTLENRIADYRSAGKTTFHFRSAKLVLLFLVLLGFSALACWRAFSVFGRSPSFLFWCLLGLVAFAALVRTGLLLFRREQLTVDARRGLVFASAQPTAGPSLVVPWDSLVGAHTETVKVRVPYSLFSPTSAFAVLDLSPRGAQHVRTGHERLPALLLRGSTALNGNSIPIARSLVDYEVIPAFINSVISSRKRADSPPE